MQHLYEISNKQKGQSKFEAISKSDHLRFQSRYQYQFNERSYVSWCLLSKVWSMASPGSLLESWLDPKPAELEPAYLTRFLDDS